jgi:hypothetical protein
MYPWNNLSTLLLIAGTKILESALDELSEEAVTELVSSQGQKKAGALLLGIYQSLEKLHASSTTLRDVLVQWVQIIRKMPEHKLRYAPDEAQDQLLTAITGVENALSELAGYVQETGIVAIRFQSSSRYTNELLEGRLMEILEPAQYQVDLTALDAGRALFIARLKHLITLEDANIKRIENVGSRIVDILKEDFGY